GEAAGGRVCGRAEPAELRGRVFPRAGVTDGGDGGKRNRQVAARSCPSTPMHAEREQRRGGPVGLRWSSRGAEQGVTRCTQAGPWLESTLFVTLSAAHTCA